MWNTRQDSSAKPHRAGQGDDGGDISERAQAGQLDGEPGHYLPVPVVGGGQGVQDRMSHGLGVEDGPVLGP